MGFRVSDAGHLATSFLFRKPSTHRRERSEWLRNTQTLSFEADSRSKMVHCAVVSRRACPASASPVQNPLLVPGEKNFAVGRQKVPGGIRLIHERRKQYNCM